MMAARLAAAVRTLGDLLGPEARDLAALPIEDLVLDSRDVRGGAAFVAVRGGRAHGLAYAAEAAANGAVVVLYEPPGDSEPAAGLVPGLPVPSLALPRLGHRLGELARRFFGTDSAKPRLAGVTGTNGKSTVAYLAAQGQTRRGQACGYLGTLGYGVPPVLTPHALTTPDCFTLHRELAELATGCAALEVSSHALAQERIAGLEIETAAFTNLSRDHLDAHGDLESYGRAKGRLFERPGLRRAVLNVGDSFAAGLLARLPAGVEALRVRVGAGADADLVASLEDRGLGGLSLEIAGRFGRATLRSPLVGDFNAENLLVALGVLLAWDVPLAEACAALATAAAPPGRLEVLGGGGQPSVVVDYAHTPDGLARVLRVLRGLTAGELCCVFGCGGERDPGKRALMGTAAAVGADRIVLTDDNPRGEDPREIIEQVRAGIDAAVGPDAVSAARVTVEHDRGRAVAEAIGAARPGDLVLVAGKGHESVQIVGVERRPFSDRQTALAALAARGDRP